MGQDKKSVVVYGPQGSGKTLHAEALRLHFQLDTVFDTNDPPPYQMRKLPLTGALILMNEPPAVNPHALHIEEALRRLHHEPAGYPLH